jgi:hypothetical protein
LHFTPAFCGHPLFVIRSSKGLTLIVSFVYPVKDDDCKDPEEQPPKNIDGIMKHAVDCGNGQEQAGQPVKDFHPFKMRASPPGDKNRDCNVGTGKGCAGIFSFRVNKIDHCLKQAALMVIFISQCDRSLDRQEYVDDITQVEQAGELENEVLEELYILAEQQNAGQGNDQIITEVKEVKKLVEKCIPMYTAEEEGGKFAEDPDIQIHKKAIQELGHDNPVDQPGLIVKQTV